MAKAGSYYYEQLNKEQQKAYYAIKEGLLNLQDSFAVPMLSTKELSDIYFMIRMDCPACNDNDHFYYKEKKLSWTTMDEVRNRTKQAVKKGKVLLFHWRGGYLTKEVLMELLDIFDQEAKVKDKRARVSVNWSQAVLRVRFEDGIGEEQIEMEEANEGEM
ncbi:MAG: hypothetical protein IKW30_02960 [Lachnospiraceae bacterium]|nr:hypothetical protein [Lachnospiraceae bacterium]